jgi:site-specific DNA recombinase
VTQQFNTTTSMGRLALNMLLSFAQFEREIAGERIRDKIARKCLETRWFPPLPLAVTARKGIMELEPNSHVTSRQTDLEP